MKRKLQLNKLDIISIVLLVLVLVIIRFFQSELFYDPFIVFFKSDYQHKALPNFEALKLYSHLFFRYALNGLITILILYILFKDKNIIKITTFLLLVFFVVLIALFYFFANGHQNYLALFYVRRFLIQPLFLILFIPAFYYQKLTNSK